MKLEFDECLHSIVEYENKRAGDRYDLASLSPIEQPGFKARVNDSAQVFRIDGIDGKDDSIITLSNENFPDSVHDAVARAKAVVDKLEDRESQYVLLPSVTGKNEHRSYAFWPRKIPISPNKILRRAQIFSIRDKVLQWIYSVGKSTLVPLDSSEQLSAGYIEPLKFVMGERNLSSTVKQAAAESLISLEEGSFRPVSLAQHGDFWYGNTLLERSWPFSLRSSPCFYVIDWGGSRLQGYPFIDPLKYLMSSTRRENIISNCLVGYSKECNLPFHDLVRYTCSYAGYLGMNRAELPHDRYIETVSALINKATGLLSKFQDSQ